jgi:hypothetical protein
VQEVQNEKPARRPEKRAESVSQTAEIRFYPSKLTALTPLTLLTLLTTFFGLFGFSALEFV